MTEIRSYRQVFDLERRIYSVDRLRLNPGGVPVRGVVYFLVLVIGELVVGGLPLVRSLAAQLPWYVRDIALPVALATVLSVIRIEGRTFHLAALALTRLWLGPRRFANGKQCAAAGALWVPADLVLLPDGSDGHLRAMRYTGPGAVLVCVEHERDGRAVERGVSATARPWARRMVTLREPRPGRATDCGVHPGDRARVIALGPGVRLRVRSRRR